MPELQAGLPASLRVDVLSDRTTGIRASVEHVEIELVLAVVLVVLVIFAFLQQPARDRDRQPRGADLAHRHLRR